MATSVALRPLGDNVIVRRETSPSETSGGIVIPEQAQEELKYGKVIAVGEGRVSDKGVRIPMSVSEGDTVYFTDYSGQEIEVDGEFLLVIREPAILAVS